MTTCSAYHVPVFLAESVDGLNIRPDGVYADMTFGGGGHSREILSRLGASGRLYGFDQDADAERNIPENDVFTSFAATSAICAVGCAIMMSRRSMESLQIWACPVIILMMRHVGFPSALMRVWICA